LNDRYKIMWKKPKKNNYMAHQEVIVFGLDSVQHVVDTIIPKDTNWDVIPM
jgi:hypothetical protein